jgi:hypothetical protein
MIAAFPRIAICGRRWGDRPACRSRISPSREVIQPQECQALEEAFGEVLT